MPPVCSMGITLARRAPDFFDFLQQLSSCFVAMEDTAFFSMLHSQLFRAGKGGTDLFTHECFCERREASGFHFLPLDSNLGQTREATSMSFYLSSYFKKLLLFYYKSFKSNQTFFQVIIHYYFHIKISQDGETASEIASD